MESLMIVVIIDFIPIGLYWEYKCLSCCSEDSNLNDERITIVVHHIRRQINRSSMWLIHSYKILSLSLIVFEAILFPRQIRIESIWKGVWLFRVRNKMILITDHMCWIDHELVLFLSKVKSWIWSLWFHHIEIYHSKSYSNNFWCKYDDCS